MAKAVAPGAEANSDDEDNKGQLTPAASAYFLRVLSTKYTLSKRNKSEMSLMCKMLDLLALGKVDRAVDFACQHLKSLEQVALDGNWNNAQFLELVETDGASLVNTTEKYMMRNEVQQQQKLSS
eukprot:3638108-Pyramimonas_sp.AAC.1